MKCRHCFEQLKVPFANLGSAPPSNAYLTKQKLSMVEKWYPLNVLVCSSCWLVQTEDYTDREELFSSEYAYFSSVSSSWLDHCRVYVSDMVQRFNLGLDSLIAEIASNDGYLLQYFQEKNIPCFGVEPTESTARVAREKGLEIFGDFLGLEFAETLVRKNYTVDLLIANNVLAHVPDINDFVAGCKCLLKPEGVASFEFPHLYQMVINAQFDTIYHEHFSYLSLGAVKKILGSNGLTIFDVEQLPTHGGSLRVFAKRNDAKNHDISNNVKRILELENHQGMFNEVFYTTFQDRIIQIKREFIGFLSDKQARNEQVVGYGAAAKGNTLLNFSGVRSDLLAYVIDRCSSKQGKYLPGSHIPIVDEGQLIKDKPEWIVIFPWNLHTEIVAQLSYVRDWGAKFVTAIPALTIF